MTTSAIDHGDELTDMLNQHGFGPVTLTRLTVAAREVPQYVIAPDSPTKARALVRWLDILDVVDAIAGKRDARDPLLRLHVRGVLPDGERVVVTATFDECTETAQTNHIYAVIDPQQIRHLVATLADIEQG